MSTWIGACTSSSRQTLVDIRLRETKRLRPRLTFARGIAIKLLRPEGGIFAMAHAMATQGLAMVLNLATGIISARLLGPSGRGEFAAISLWLLLPSLLAIAGIQNSIVYQTGRRPDQAASISVAGALLSTVLFLPMAAFCYWWMVFPMHAYGPATISVARLVLIISIINAWLIIVRQSLLAVRNFRGYNIGGYGGSLVYCAMLLGLLGVHYTTPASFVWAQAGATLLVLIALAVSLVSKWDWRNLHPFRCMPDVASYAWKAASIDVVTVLILNIDRLILVGMLSPEMFGIYAVALSFARILLILQQAVSAVALVELIKLSPAQITIFIHRVFRLLLWTLLVASGFACLFDRWLLGIVYGPDFVQAAPIFRVLLIEASTACIGQVLMQAFLASGAPAIPSFVQVISIAATVIGMLALVPAYGAIGAAAALALASGLRLALLLGCLRLIGVSLPNPLPRLSDISPIIAQLHNLKRGSASAL